MEYHYLNSSYREKLIEHLFVGELLKLSWANKDFSLEISKPEVDYSGYDIIAETRGVIRHIQLKTSHRNAKAASQKVNMSLAKKPSGCIIWVKFDEEKANLGPFLYFGGEPGAPLPTLGNLKTVKHTKGNAQGIKLERPNIKVVPKARFRTYESIEGIFTALFGSNTIRS